MGLTVLDAGVIIGFLDGRDAHHEAAESAFRNAQARNDTLVLPASALAEALVGPSRSGAEAVAVVRRFIERVPVKVEPLVTEISLVAAELWARHRSLKLPDALVIATAGHLNADLLVTTDRGWPTKAQLNMATSITEI